MADYNYELEPSRNLARSLYNGEVPLGWLRAALGEAVASVCPLDRCPSSDRLRDSLILLGESIDLLLDKTGERAIAARTALTTERESLQASLELLESLGGVDLGGPKALEIFKRIAMTRAAKKEYELAVELAPPDAVLGAIGALERAKAEGRVLCREVVALGRSLQALSKRALPSREAFDAARERTQELANLPSRKPKAAHLQLALTQGENAKPEEARYWPCFEGSHTLFEIRAERFAERGT